MLRRVNTAAFANPPFFETPCTVSEGKIKYFKSSYIHSRDQLKSGQISVPQSHFWKFTQTFLILQFLIMLYKLHPDYIMHLNVFKRINLLIFKIVSIFLQLTLSFSKSSLTRSCIVFGHKLLLAILCSVNQIVQSWLKSISFQFG